MNSSTYKRVVNKMRIMQHYQLWLLNWLMTTNKHISHIGAGGGVAVFNLAFELLFAQI